MICADSRRAQRSAAHHHVQLNRVWRAGLETNDSFVGVQVTRSTERQGNCAIHKDKTFLVDMIGEKGLLVFSMLYVREHCRCVMLLSPDDLPEIESTTKPTGRFV
jgi:hypothetical protein